MNVNPLKSSSDRLSETSTSSSSGESLDEFHRDLLQADAILGDQFGPRRDSYSASDESRELTSTGKNTCRSKGKLRLFVWAT